MIVVVVVVLRLGSVCEKSSMQRDVIVLDGEEMRICGQHGLQWHAFDVVRSGDAVSKEAP